MELDSFLSPRTKLLRFFVRSRDGWKKKCRQSKSRVKYLGNRVQKLTASRDRWKQQAQSLTSELELLQAELQELKTG